jgi:hypothetical protein
MTKDSEQSVAHLVVYGATAADIQSKLSEHQIGSLNAYVANTLMEHGVDVDVALVSGERADELAQFDASLRA